MIKEVRSVKRLTGKASTIGPYPIYRFCDRPQNGQDGNEEIYVMNADGSNQTRLTDNLRRDYFPVFSSDGNTVIFVSDRNGDAEIYAMNADGSGTPTNLTNNPAHDSAPDWGVAENTPPEAQEDNYTTDEDTELKVDAPGVLANDTYSGDTLKAVKVSDPSNGRLTLNEDGSFTYTPNENFDGTDSFTYKASDGINESNVATVSITVKPVEDCTIMGTESSNLLLDTPGDDVICGKGGNDIIIATEGGNDVIYGDGGRDVLGTKGNATFKGGEGDDILFKKDKVSGNDTLDGEAGNDFCLADKGDKLTNCERGSTSSLSTQERERFNTAKEKATSAKS